MLKKIVFKTYSFFSTLFENIFLKEQINIENSSIIKFGYEVLPVKKIFQFSIDKNNIIKINPYLKKIELRDDQISKIIRIIFIENGLAMYLKKCTGFNYSISHITAYQTSHIPKEVQDQPFYANHWHKDGPYSKNTLKVIIPLTDIEKEDCGMMICNKDQSLKFSFFSKANILADKIFEFQSKMRENIFIFNPHLCLHKAGNPSENRVRQQLVFQINPSFEWSINKNLFKTQLIREPKFPLINLSLLKNTKL